MARAKSTTAPATTEPKAAPAGRIVMMVSMAGVDFSYYPGQELTVGVEIDAETAAAFCADGRAQGV